MLRYTSNWMKQFIKIKGVERKWVYFEPCDMYKMYSMQLHITQLIRSNAP